MDGYILNIMMFIEWEKVNKCTSEERKALSLYINRLIELKVNFEREGITGFETFISSEADIFEKKALQLVMQGYMPNVCEKVLFNILNVSKFDGREYLKNVIFIDFILMLQKGHIGMQELRIMLLSYLGVEYINI